MTFDRFLRRSINVSGENLLFSTKQVFKINDYNFALTAGRLQFLAINSDLSGIEDNTLPNIIPGKSCWKSA